MLKECNCLKPAKAGNNFVRQAGNDKLCRTESCLYIYVYIYKCVLYGVLKTRKTCYTCKPVYISKCLCSIIKPFWTSYKLVSPRCNQLKGQTKTLTNAVGQGFSSQVPYQLVFLVENNSFFWGEGRSSHVTICFLLFCSNLFNGNPVAFWYCDKYGMNMILNPGLWYVLISSRLPGLFHQQWWNDHQSRRDTLGTTMFWPGLCRILLI